jgi:predicted esterase
LSSRQWSKVKAFQSTGDNDGLVKPSDIKRVSEELKRGGVKQIVAKTFPGNHTMSDDLFKEALDWFEKEEAQ